uniref:Ovule protein n=1 Tax=Romanomermis culicivorax TaxID=13658 RepID=A0A915JPM2_ROMCU
MFGDFPPPYFCNNQFLVILYLILNERGWRTNGAIKGHDKDNNNSTQLMIPLAMDNTQHKCLQIT